jgi:hypothetical protein
MEERSWHSSCRRLKPHLDAAICPEVGPMALLVALVLILLLAWLLGLGNVVHLDATIHVGGGLQTLLIIVVVVVLCFALVRGRPFRL